MAWSKSSRITIMLAIDTAFFILELGVGLVVGSLALMADAFHMLNDIISLVVGLWAVKVAQKASNDKYSFGWLRAEILGAFFNAVFLIALCLSIVLEAITRLIDPPEIGNPELILIVGSLGLVSNLAGFFVLGGHGHSHGAEQVHQHEHGNEVGAMEEGHHDARGEQVDTDGHRDDLVGEILPEAIVAKVKSRTPQLNKAISADENASISKDSETSLNRSFSKASSRSRQRTMSRSHGRFSSLDGISIHPASFRQEIIAASKAQQLDGIDSEGSNDSEEEAVIDENEEGQTEISPLLHKATVKTNGSSEHKSRHSQHPLHSHQRSHSRNRGRRDSLHASHNHNKPKRQGKSGHSHSHADMGMNAMILHVIGDALGNVGVIVSALVIWFSTSSIRFYADPAVSLFITLIILRSTVPLTSATAKILLQATPDHIDVTEIKEDIQAIPGVISCHHMHIWQLSDTQIVASMHVQVAFPISEAGGEKYMELARAARKCLHAYGIHSATLQPEFCLDQNHDHIDGPSVGLDGIVNQISCRLDDDLCLLECVDDCKDKGCCSTPAHVESQREHLSHPRQSH